MNMVTSQYFDSGVPMMRCMKDFLCQFGINSDPTVTKTFKSNIKDDPNWLPEGPEYRENADGVKRFAKGYLAYAGGGKNSVSWHSIHSTYSFFSGSLVYCSRSVNCFLKDDIGF
jgi:hypothetical protein